MYHWNGEFWLLKQSTNSSIALVAVERNFLLKAMRLASFVR
jgi:hypothetical protein